MPIALIMGTGFALCPSYVYYKEKLEEEGFEDDSGEPIAVEDPSLPNS